VRAPGPRRAARRVARRRRRRAPPPLHPPASLQIVSLATGQVTSRFPMPAESAILSPDGKTIAVRAGGALQVRGAALRRSAKGACFGAAVVARALPPAPLAGLQRSPPTGRALPHHPPADLQHGAAVEDQGAQGKEARERSANGERRRRACAIASGHDPRPPPKPRARFRRPPTTPSRCTGTGCRRRRSALSRRCVRENERARAREEREKKESALAALLAARLRAHPLPRAPLPRRTPCTTGRRRPTAAPTPSRCLTARPTWRARR